MEDGSDLFLSLTGAYRRSRWLGLSLDSIATHPTGGPSAGIPRQLAQLVTFLDTAQSLATSGLFVESIQNVLVDSDWGGATAEALSTGHGVSRAMQRALLRRLSPLVEALEQEEETPPPEASA